MVKRREDLTTPRASRRLGLSYDPDAFGRFSEAIARFLGTGRFLAIQTVIVVVWIFLNVALITLQWDPYPFILLNLAFSTQAAYAAPLILLAQSRQERRDHVQAELDRQVAERTQADTEFLAREIAGVRLLLADGVTGEELREELSSLSHAVERLGRRLDHLDVQASGTALGADPTDGRDGRDGSADPGEDADDSGDSAAAAF
jgi:uncharacterized membrane protein